MYRIQTMNKISSAGLSVLDKLYFQVGDSVEKPHGILVRSADMKEYPFPKSLRAIGTDHSHFLITNFFIDLRFLLANV